MIVVFASCHDPATRCSHWVALRNVERLSGELGCAYEMIAGASARRDALEAALAGEVDGLAFFGHGQEERLLGEQRVSVVDETNLALLRGRWVHAFACRAGVQLAGSAAAAGVRCFAGYESALIVEWDPDAIPLQIRGAFFELVTQTTLELARGVHDVTTIRRAARDAQAEVIAWCDEHPGEAPGLEIMAQQLLARLVVRRADADDAK